MKVKNDNSINNKNDEIQNFVESSLEILEEIEKDIEYEGCEDFDNFIDFSLEIIAEMEEDGQN